MSVIAKVSVLQVPALLLTLFLSVIVIDATQFSKPDISIGLNVDHDTTTGSFCGVEPRVKWCTNDVSVGNLFDVQGGIDLTVTDVQKPPRIYVWGEAKRGTTSIRGDLDANDSRMIDLDFRLNEFLDKNINLRVLGSIDLKSKTVKADQVSSTINIDAPVVGGKLTIDPRYDLRSQRPDARVGYTFRDTSFKVDGQSRKLSISHMFGNKRRNRINPTFHFGKETADEKKKKKNFSLSYNRNLQDGGQVTTQWKPDDSLSIQWNDGGWSARIHAPIEGYYKINNGIKLNVKQSIDVSL